MKVLISGSHGLIGQALLQRLTEDGHTVVRLVRHGPTGSDVVWNPYTGAMDPFALEGFDGVVHLGGVSIGEKRWSEKVRGQIWDSRVNSTDFLAQRIAQAIDRPNVFVVASALGYYGERGDEQLSETSTKGDGFLAEVTANWEDAAQPAVAAGVRTVHLRSGIVLGVEGGLIHRLLPVFRTALGGKLGSGKQYMSWISLHDEVNAIMFALTNNKISGAINLCSPNPVTNAEFTRTFAEVLRRPAFIPLWPWMLKLAFGPQLTEEMLLVSQRAYPRKLENAGFLFNDRHLAQALRSILSRSEPTLEQEQAAEKQNLTDKILKGRKAKIFNAEKPSTGKHAKPDEVGDTGENHDG